jgi:hypothetical protein
MSACVHTQEDLRYGGARVSVVVLAIMLVYGAMRAALWARGQWRFYRLRGELPRVQATPIEAPAHLGGALAGLLARSHAGRVRLVECARQVAMVLIIDPDVAFGCVRDPRFRWALADAWTASTAWLRAYESLSEHDRRRLEEFGYTLERFSQSRAALGLAARRCIRAPALEPFAVDDVRAVQELLMTLVRDLEGCERALLAGSPDHPYRAVG